MYLSFLVWRYVTPEKVLDIGGVNDLLFSRTQLFFYLRIATFFSGRKIAREHILNIFS